MKERPVSTASSGKSYATASTREQREPDERTARERRTKKSGV